MKCEICGKEILRDSQCINYKYYHNDCIENLQQENKKQKEAIGKAIEYLNSKQAMKYFKGAFSYGEFVSALEDILGE